MRGKWGDGKDVVCLMSALVPGARSVNDCVTDGWPEWLAELVVGFYDAPTGADDEQGAADAWAYELAAVIAQPVDYEQARHRFMVAILEPVAHLSAAVPPVIALHQRALDGDQPSQEQWAASRAAAWGASGYASRYAAGYASRAAALAASRDAAGDASGYAARAASAGRIAGLSGGRIAGRSAGRVDCRHHGPLRPWRHPMTVGVDLPPPERLARCSPQGGNRTSLHATWIRMGAAGNRGVAAAVTRR